MPISHCRRHLLGATLALTSLAAPWPRPTSRKCASVCRPGRE
nr:hypothetical protein [Halomonas elongata]